MRSERETPDLVQIGNTPFYRSSGEPAHPRDCARWPNSPYCGGTTWTLSPVGFEVDVISTQCDFGITTVPVLGFTRAPNIDFVYRKRGCRPDPPPPPPKPDDPPETQRVNLPLDFYGVFVISEKKIWEGRNYYSEWSNVKVRTHPNIDELGYWDIWIEIEASFIERGVQYPGGPIIENVITSKDGYLPHGKLQIVKGVIEWYQRYMARYYSWGFSYFHSGYEAGSLNGTQNKGSGLLKVILGYYWEILEHFGRAAEINSRFGKVTTVYKIENYEPISIDYAAPPPGPPARRKPTRRNRMNCCYYLKYQNDRILQDLAEIRQRLGVEEYPAIVPSSLSGNGTAEIQNLTRLTGWLFERIDEVSGQYPIEVEIQDIDPEKTGDQKEKVTMPNIAEALAEIFGLSMQAAINSEVLVSLAVKNLVESGEIKTLGSKNFFALDLLTEYFGVDFKNSKIELPLSFTPGSNDISAFLKDSNIEIPKPDIREGSQTYKDDLRHLLHAADIIKTVHWRKLDPRSSLAAQIVSLIKLYKENSDRFSAESWDQVVEDIEQGQTNKTATSSKPYGKDPTYRPKVTEIINPEELQ
ncbi:MAG: hypothetical protein F6K21_05540 [Symploca sp. SIO2D2]|nr:hypothetical protein [Symploca sp. SIO2D2]